MSQRRGFHLGNCIKIPAPFFIFMLSKFISFHSWNLNISYKNMHFWRIKYAYDKWTKDMRIFWILCKYGSPQLDRRICIIRRRTKKSSPSCSYFLRLLIFEVSYFHYDYENHKIAHAKFQPTECCSFHRPTLWFG